MEGVAINLPPYNAHSVHQNFVYGEEPNDACALIHRNDVYRTVYTLETVHSDQRGKTDLHWWTGDSEERTERASKPQTAE